ncbi:hypothetical protein KC349_g5403 [Hortaea werneckii]|nr:hypothetical protein KC349_g5403 [Hortaea werneckii]
MDETHKLPGFFNLPRELRNVIYRECGHYTLREGCPTLNLVEVELTKHCAPELRLVNRQFKAEFEEEMSRQDGEASLSICFMNTPKTACFRTVSDMYAATARRTSQNLFTVCIIRPEGTSNTLPPPTFAQTVLSIRPNAQLRQLSLTCSIDRANVQNTLTFAEKLLSQFSSISTFKMQIHQWLIAPPHSAPDPGDMDYCERVAERIRNFYFNKGSTSILKSDPFSGQF